MSYTWFLMGVLGEWLTRLPERIIAFLLMVFFTIIGHRLKALSYTMAMEFNTIKYISSNRVCSITTSIFLNRLEQWLVDNRYLDEDSELTLNHARTNIHLDPRLFDKYYHYLKNGEILDLLTMCVVVNDFSGDLYKTLYNPKHPVWADVQLQLESRNLPPIDMTVFEKLWDARVK